MKGREREREGRGRGERGEEENSEGLEDITHSTNIIFYVFLLLHRMRARKIQVKVPCAFYLILMYQDKDDAGCNFLDWTSTAMSFSLATFLVHTLYGSHVYLPVYELCIVLSRTPLLAVTFYVNFVNFWLGVFLFSGGESDGGLREDNSHSEASDSESEDDEDEDEDEDARRDAPLSTVVKKLREIGEYREQTADRQSSSASHNSNSFTTGLGGQVEWIQSKLRRAADDRQDEGK